MVIQIAKKKKVWIGLGLLLTVIIALIVLLFGAEIYDLFKGDLDIRYVGFDRKTGVVKIEVLNSFKFPLKFVEGTITISCIDKSQIVRQSKPFKLEGGKEFFPKEQNELLFFPDTFFSKLIESKGVDCVDSSLEVAKYSEFNETHSGLENINVYDFVISGNNSIGLSKREYLEGRVPIKLCISCNFSISVLTRNKGIFNEKEFHKFLSEESFESQYDEVMGLLHGVTPSFCIFRLRRLANFPLCINLTSSECANLLREKIKNQYDYSDYCINYSIR